MAGVIRSTYDYPESQGPFPIVWHLPPPMPPLDNSCLFLYLQSNDIPIAITSAVNEQIKLFYNCYKNGATVDRQTSACMLSSIYHKVRQKKSVKLNIRLSSAASSDVKFVFCSIKFSKSVW